MTGRATFHTIIIDQPAFYLTRASGLKTNSQTVYDSVYFDADNGGPSCSFAVHKEDNDDIAMLKDFDLDWKFGPSIGEW